MKPCYSLDRGLSGFLWSVAGAVVDDHSPEMMFLILFWVIALSGLLGSKG
jgi:hypothetical protein